VAFGAEQIGNDQCHARFVFDQKDANKKKVDSKTEVY